VTRCEWAGCTRLATTQEDDYDFCRPHLSEHRHLAKTDSHLLKKEKTA